MKSKTLAICAVLSLLLPLAWSVFELSAQTANQNDDTTTPSRLDPLPEHRTPEVAAMIHEQSRIANRVHMAAPMELELVNGIDSIAEAVKTGFIINVSLEEVEAAIKAAAATPEIEDDKRATDLAHRGSYRFFAPR